jgi:SAM-dependent methyltransferase
MPPSRLLSEDILNHYGRSNLESIILTALSAAGKDVTNLNYEDLAPIDEFHIRGRQATRELARAAGIEAGQQVLDVGCGIGGPSRFLARECGCRVVGIDLSADYCRVATTLAERSGLAPRISYRQGNALALDFPDETFDVVWTQHVAMNISDKAALYRELRRVLKQGGALAIYDILAGPVEPVLYPVPWARLPETSFLARPEELRLLLGESGFELISWEDTTAAAVTWFAAFAAKIRQHGLPPLGIHLLLGPDFPLMADNQARNLREGRIVLAQIVARK